MRLRKILWFPIVISLAACVPPTYSKVQTTPVQLSDGGLGYIYQGRANFPGQLTIADQSMQDHCRSIGRSQAVIVDRQIQNIGSIGMANVYGTAGGLGVNSNTLANQNQQILFRCS